MSTTIVVAPLVDGRAVIVLPPPFERSLILSHVEMLRLAADLLEAARREWGAVERLRHEADRRSSP